MTTLFLQNNVLNIILLYENGLVKFPLLVLLQLVFQPKFKHMGNTCWHKLFLNAPIFFRYNSSFVEYWGSPFNISLLNISLNSLSLFLLVYNFSSTIRKSFRTHYLSGTDSHFSCINWSQVFFHFIVLSFSIIIFQSSCKCKNINFKYKQRSFMNKTLVMWKFYLNVYILLQTMKTILYYIFILFIFLMLKRK